MRLFGRKSEPVEPAEAIDDFWTWWRETRPRIDAHVEAEEAEALAELIGGAVTALHPNLVWEIAPGRTAQHALVVSASGDPELRSFAHRWALAAPTADDLWEFHPSRQANPQAVELAVDVGGREFGLEGLVLGLRVPPGTPRVDVSAFHPIFPDIDDETRMEATLMALDWLLGEDEVARWVGDIVAAEFEPIDAIPAVHLPAVVADVAAGFKDEQWALLEGQTATGGRLIAAARYPLRPVDYPLFDQHITITVPYEHSDEDGLPSGASLQTLRDFEERLAGRLGKLGSAVLAAHLSAEGNRVLHVYADPSGDAALVLKELAGTWQEGRPRVDVESDPSWSAVAPFLT
ncbi:DUF695 domain-containing protein [Planotetraspora sp. A-T 1434]|uniref:DUF695 domain-containing protein n=1 Tax=Planotetraspora sp. A-T 1434 TaxID=2979219 RepID=UPI0021C0517A|nr:DUF695 domain-containing protein [Planotetraspora sp. A-T 1434]MCT9931368.1 DUF695 domain-containing protein [Planotetraspora sp. A-T 1434]